MMTMGWSRISLRLRKSFTVSPLSHRSSYAYPITRKSLPDVVEHHKNGGHSSEAVENLVMGL